MQSSVTRPKRPAPGSKSGWGAWLLRQWQAFTRNEDEDFLCAARDLADLERRLRHLERGRAERFGSMQRAG